MKLRPSDEDAAVGVGSRAEFQLQREVFRELARRPHLLDAATFGRSRHDNAAMLRDVATIGTRGLAVERRLLLLRLLIAEAPTGQVLSIEEADRTRFGLEIVVGRFEVAERREDRSQRRGPFRVAKFVWMKQVGEFSRFRITLFVGEELPRFDQRHLCIPLHGGGIKLVDLLDLVRRSRLRSRTREDQAENHRHLRIVLLQLSQDQLEVARDRFRFGLLFQIVCSHEQHDAGRVECQHIVLQANQHPARRVAADPTVRDLHARKASPHVVAPALRDRVTQEHERLLIFLDLLRPTRSLLSPQIFEPVIPPDRSRTGETLVGGRKLDGRLRGLFFRTQRMRCEAECHRGEQQNHRCRGGLHDGGDQILC